MSLDFYQDAIDSMRESGHPFVIICAPKGTLKSFVLAEGVLESLPIARSAMACMDTIYDKIYNEYGEAGLLDIEWEEEEGDEYEEED